MVLMLGLAAFKTHTNQRRNYLSCNEIFLDKQLGAASHYAAADFPQVKKDGIPAGPPEKKVQDFSRPSGIYRKRGEKSNGVHANVASSTEV